MPERIQSIRGIHDVLPPVSETFSKAERAMQAVLSQYGYQEIRLPMLEQTELFKRSLGEVTDIVEKEMYTFRDRNGDSLALRPEGTAGFMRAGIQHGFLYQQPARFWYSGPFFRRERPQKGRYRQFHQIGAEAFGFTDPDIDAELIMLSQHIWRKLSIKPSLEINSLGNLQARQTYRGKLIAYLQQHENKLNNEERRRLHTNPMRILDSKNQNLQTVIDNAPSLTEYLDAESREHFEGLRQLLAAANIEYTINPRLVRGLDYYSKTVFEWTANKLPAAQATVCAGGRYDGLAQQLGGKPCTAVGFAIGLERLVALLGETRLGSHVIDAYLVLLGQEAERVGVKIIADLRTKVPDCSVVMNCGGGSIKSQMKRADKSNAKLAVILGGDEIENNKATVKFLREQRDQETVPQENLVSFFNKYLSIGE